MLALMEGRIEWVCRVCGRPVHQKGLLIAEKPRRPEQVEPFMLVHTHCQRQAEILLPGGTITVPMSAYLSHLLAQATRPGRVVEVELPRSPTEMDREEFFEVLAASIVPEPSEPQPRSAEEVSDAHTVRADQTT